MTAAMTPAMNPADHGHVTLLPGVREAAFRTVAAGVLQPPIGACKKVRDAGTFALDA